MADVDFISYWAPFGPGSEGYDTCARFVRRRLPRTARTGSSWCSGRKRPRRRRCSRPLCRWLAGRWPRSTGVRADSRHSGTAGTRVKGVDATFMLLERYGSGIQVVSVRRRRSGEHVSPVTTACQERRNTSSQGRDVRYPAQDQLQLNGTAARLRPDAIRTRPQRSRRHGQRIGLSSHAVRTPRIGHGEHQTGRESW